VVDIFLVTALGDQNETRMTAASLKLGERLNRDHSTSKNDKLLIVN
jgi:hypothetical protein